MAEPGKSYCAEHQVAKNREHDDNVSPGTTLSWKKQRDRIRRRDRHRCRHCGRTQNLQVHHMDGGGIRTPTPDSRLILLCRPCHAAAQKALRAKVSSETAIGRSRAKR